MLSLSLNKALNIMLLETVNSLMCIWDCDVIHHLTDDYAGIENDEYQDPCADSDYIDEAI